MNWKRSAGFTIIELLIVMAIIVLFSTAGYVGYTNATQQGRAVKVLSDFEKIETAWKVWHLDNGAYLDENLYYNPSGGQNDNVCGGGVGTDDPTISMTDLTAQKASSPSTWKGPYLTTTLHDPFGHEYLYDNDPTETYPAFPTNGGVNIMVHYCGPASSYQDLQRRLDQMVDKTDGVSAASQTGGKIHWDGINIYYMLSPQSTE